jgi:hypothetical protein
MLDDFKDGQFIKATELEQWLKEIYGNIRLKVTNLIPKGSLTAYSFLANKIFSYRPYSNAQSYSTIPKDEPLLGEKTAYSLGTPWTLQFGKALNIQASTNFSGLTSTYIKGDIFPYEPLTDLVNNMPLKGNSPLIYKGFIGLSNNCQDTNIRVYPSEDGTVLYVKALRVSALHRYTSSTNYQITTDFVNSIPDREELEWKHIDNLNISVLNSSVFTSTSSGFSPSISNSNDYGVWLLYNPQLAVSRVVLTKWDANYPAISNIVNNIYTSSTPAYYNTTVGTTYPYTRCLACVYLNSDGKFEYSKEKIWGEYESISVNGNPLFTKLYQQDSSLNTVIRNQTNALDRRVIPSYYYQEQKNTAIQSLVNYQGIIRDVPSAGMAQCSINCDGTNLTFKTNCLELSNGTSSYFMNSIAKDFTAYNFLCDTGTGSAYVYSSGSHTTISSYYMWAAVNPYSVLEQNIEGFNASTTQSGFMAKTNMQFKLFASQSDSWAGISSGFRSAELKGFDWRCRVGWFKRSLSYGTYTPASGGGITPFANIDGNTYMAIRPQEQIFTVSGTSVGVNQDYSTYTTISTATVSTIVPQISKFLPTVNCNSTNSTVDWVSGIMKSFNTSSTALTPTAQMIVDTDYSVFGGIPAFYTPWLSSSTSSGTVCKGRHVLTNPFHIPIYSTNSSIRYYYNCNIAGSIGAISFNNFYLPNGAF